MVSVSNLKSESLRTITVLFFVLFILCISTFTLLSVRIKASSTIILLLIFLKIIYIKYSVSVSNKNIIADIFPLFAVSILLTVITN